jgi:hypothetical protein
LERKTSGDLKDLLKTMVAFANSVRPGHVATVLIGERNDGTPEGLSNPDEIQQRVRKEADKIYPQIIWQSEVYDNGGKECVRVEIEYSGDTPHFGGPAWVRRGSETIKASNEEFQRLIDIRSSVVRELDQWVGEGITLDIFTKYTNGSIQKRSYHAKLTFVNQFYATLQYDGRSYSHPLKDLTISWADDTSRLKLILEEIAFRTSG